MDWANRIVGYGTERVEDLLASPLNYRIHPLVQQEAMLAAIHEIGLVQTIIVNRLTGCVVDGHLRVALAMREGVETLPTAYVELSEAEEAKVLLSFDTIGAMAGIDKTKLGELVQMVEGDTGGLGEFISGLLPGKPLPAEHRISPELLERQDYLVFIFDNQIDWAAVCEIFGVGTAYQQDPATASAGKQFAIFGTGRVLMGKELLSKLHGTIAEAIAMMPQGEEEE